MYRCQRVSCVHTCNSKSLQHSCVQIRVLCSCANLQVCASQFLLCAVHVNVSHVYTEYIWGGIDASAHPFSCLHTNTMKVRICRQDGKSDVMQLQTLGGITRNITHSVRKTQACFPTLILAGRLLRETSFGSEWKKVKKRIQVREGKTTHTQEFQNVTEKREISICIRSEAGEKNW